ncbi:MAG: hypothetical protein MJ070_09690 [Lachnospiraceae bacterium]|nr:hypothetical protein [Lachnospiraceae bacterium]
MAEEKKRAARPAAKSASLSRNVKAEKTAVKKKAAAKKPVAEDAPAYTYQTVNAKKKSPFPLSAVLTTFFCTLLFMFMIFNYVQINEYSQSIKDIQSDMETLNGKQKDLRLELNKRNDVTEILKQAEELGMVRTEGVKKIYLDGTGEDMIEITDKGAGTEEAGFFSDIMSALAQNFRDIAEYLNGN